MVLEQGVAAAQCWSSEPRRGDTPHPSSGAAAVRRYPTFNVRSSREEILHVQVDGGFAGAGGPGGAIPH